MFKPINERSDYFFPALPKWVTHYGFALMLALMALSLVAASFIRYSREVQVPVIVQSGEPFALLTFREFRDLPDSQILLLDGPFTHRVVGRIEKKIRYISGDHVASPLVIKDSVVLDLPAVGEIRYKGTYQTASGSLLRNLLRR
jgi:hypothetical protein